MSGTTALAPFRTRSFRYQWPADLLAAWALEMETLILGWYVLVESGSVVLLTLFGALMFVGTLVSPLLGMLGDRLGLRPVLAAIRLSYALFAAAILLLAASGRLHPAGVLVIAFGAGLIKPTDIGMRSAVFSATVPAEHLVAAMGVSRTTQDSARVGLHSASCRPTCASWRCTWPGCCSRCAWWSWRRHPARRRRCRHPPPGHHRGAN